MKLQKILDFIIPPACNCCGTETGTNGGLCQECWQEINFIHGKICKTCGIMLSNDFSDNDECEECIINPPDFEKAISVAEYSQSTARLISRFKYKDRTETAVILSDLMMRKGRIIIEDAEIIAPVPIHRLRLISRGYNQSAIIAARIAKKYGKLYLPEIICRKTLTPPQASLTKAERLKNVEKVFGVPDRFKQKIIGKRILIIDDVMTTGATMRAISHELKQNGAESVYALTFARTHEKTYLNVDSFNTNI